MRMCRCTRTCVGCFCSTFANFEGIQVVWTEDKHYFFPSGSYITISLIFLKLELDYLKTSFWMTKEQNIYFERTKFSFRWHTTPCEKKIVTVIFLFLNIPLKINISQLEQINRANTFTQRNNFFQKYIKHCAKKIVEKFNRKVGAVGKLSHVFWTLHFNGLKINENQKINELNYRKNLN